MTSPDPILARRARYAAAAATGKRLGWLCFVIATVAFFLAIVTGFNDALGSVVIGGLIVGSMLLLPAIITAYAVRAAERHDLGLPDGH